MRVYCECCPYEAVCLRYEFDVGVASEIPAVLIFDDVHGQRPVGSQFGSAFAASYRNRENPTINLGKIDNASLTRMHGRKAWHNKKPGSHSWESGGADQRDAAST